jgi:hypothetical protein
MRWVLWALGGVTLVVFGLILRRVLGLDRAEGESLRGWVRLTADRESGYQSIALEIEAQAFILGVSLNDAVEEGDSGKPEFTWGLVGLVDCEWRRLVQAVTGLLIGLAKYMPVARVVVPVRNIAAHYFKSPSRVDYPRMHEEFDQLVFRYKARFLFKFVFCSAPRRLSQQSSRGPIAMAWRLEKVRMKSGTASMSALTILI